MEEKKFVNFCKKHLIGTVINFCSYDFAFLAPCLESVRNFSKQVIIPVCDHMFGGEQENSALLQKIYTQFPEAQFIEFPFDFNKREDAHYWHNLSRLIGSFFLQEEIEFVLFIDCDEILDSKSFMIWLDSSNYSQFMAMRLANYWYFRDVSHQATTWEDSPLFLRKIRQNIRMLMHPRERAGTYSSVQSKKKRMVLSLERKPMVHHYSWVRTKEQMLKKVSNWGHSQERNWKLLIEREFSSDFQGTDFVHGYSFQTADCPFEIDLLAQPKQMVSSVKNFLRLSHNQVHYIDLHVHFGVDAQFPPFF